ncbi:unnamed protein product [Aphanomyces euteiches]|uniref:histone deacetylase n=1 Tax=Aphanomyces euteiches TaxID=100861 RepID=A0A6G0WNT5_9STRA|nr:hypothetical protein Ae201684_013291 [Aphanomyces euteiches]KAH9064804.1 hypothetical protein Ae201684P_003586 [Aphanomyces euteiches]KAH9155852.1 hypothetical protein AeRB84_002206 [Aphanomyces euteiches]
MEDVGSSNKKPTTPSGARNTPLHETKARNSPLIPYSPFLMESYHMSANLGLSASLHGFSSPASFFSGCPSDDPHSDHDDMYSSLSHLPSASNKVTQHHGAEKEHTSDDDDDEEEQDEDDDDEDLAASLWNCLVCTRLNQNDQCVFCGQDRDRPFEPQPPRTQPRQSQAPRPVQTAIGYDDRMRFHREIEPRDKLDLHPERPDRIAAIYAQCQQDGVIERCTHIPSVLVDKADLLRCHDAEYLDEIHQLFQLPFHHITPDTYCCRDSDTAAKLSAGIVVSLVDKVLRREVRNGFAIVRPPGHHAESPHAMGFCLFNNVAVAAKTAVEKFGLRRVLILDWDIHHGNGTEHMFHDDPTVLYASLHRFDNHGAFYPGTGAPDSVGSGAGAGFNVNIGWPSGGMGDAEYLAAFDRVLMPIFRSFVPELVLVSAGFDSALGDPLGRCRITPTGYAHMTHLVSSLADGKVVMALEGGYNLKSIAASASACIQILLGDAVPPLNDMSPPMESALRAIETTRRCLEPFWPCLCVVEEENDDEDDNDDQASQQDTLAAKVELARRLDPRILADVRAKLLEKRRQRYRPYRPSHKLS